MKSVAYIGIILFLTSLAIRGAANGNHSLNLSYTKTKKGLNFVHGSGKAGLRFWPPVGSWPVNVSISGIPSTAVIEKAFVYFTTGYFTSVPPSNPQLYFINPLTVSKTFVPTKIGVDIPKCWGEYGNVTYRADVTNYITGNGTYTLSSNTGDTTTDGFTLLIIYSFDSAHYSGQIVINDGLMIDSNDLPVTRVALSVTDTPILAKCFFIASDIQDNGGLSPATMRFIDGTRTSDYSFNRDFWNFESVPYDLHREQTYVDFHLFQGYNDCVAWSLAGVYMQMLDTDVAISDPLLDTLYCLGDTFQLKYNVSNWFNPNNTFNVFLSDWHGNFTNKILIGSKNAIGGGYVTCVIPPNLPSDSNYKIRITATSPVDTVENNDQRIRISDYPLPPVVASSTPACEGTTLHLYDFSTDNAAQYTWTGPNNFKRTLRSPDLNNTPLAAAGKYFFFKENYSCGFKDSLIVVVKPRPLKPSMTVTAGICEGDTVKVTAYSITPTITYNLLTPSRFMSGLLNVDTAIAGVTIADSGVYRVAAVLDGCISLVDSTNGIVYRMPSLHAQSNSPVCHGSNIEFKAGDTTLGASYLWKGPLGFSAPLRDLVLGNAAFINVGTYSVVANVHQCADTDTVSVVVKPNPPIPKLSSNSPICANDSLNLFVTDSLASTFTYTWTGPNGFHSDSAKLTIDTASVKATGKYSMAVGLDGCSSYDTIDVLVKPMPEEPMPINNGPLKKGERLQLDILHITTDASYKWVGPNNFASALISPYLDAMRDELVGEYNVAVDLNGCITNGSTDVEIYKDDDSTYLVLYPSPNNGNFMLEGKFTVDQKIGVFITNIPGQLLYQHEFETENQRLKVLISIPFVADGFYYLKIDVNGKRKTMPFVIGR